MQRCQRSFDSDEVWEKDNSCSTGYVALFREYRIRHHQSWLCGLWQFKDGGVKQRDAKENSINAENGLIMRIK